MADELTVDVWGDFVTAYGEELSMAIDTAQCLYLCLRILRLPLGLA